MNAFETYYTNQAGSGIVGYSGYRYQKGDGFFGRLVSGTLLPWLKKSLGFIGKNAVQAGVNIGGDLLAKNDFSKNSIKEVAKKRGKEQAKAMAKEMIKSITTGQEGSGRRRRRRRRRRKPKRKKVVLRPKLIKGRKRTTRKSRRKRTKKEIKAKDFLS